MKEVNIKQFRVFLGSEMTAYKEELKLGFNILSFHFNKKDELIATGEFLEGTCRYKVRWDCL